MKRPKHWQDPVSGLLGIWLVAAPWVLGFVGPKESTGNFLVAGAVLIATALGAVLVPRAWEEWTEAAVGLWLVVSPWALGFHAHHNATIAAVVPGVLILILAAWTLATDTDYNAWLHRRIAR
jgi:hypothetical protein